MKRHPLDPFSLVFGILFSVLGLVLLNSSIDVGDITGRWLIPLPLLVAAAILVALGVNQMNRGSNEDE